MTETFAMPINAPCRRLAALNCGPHPLYRVQWRRYHINGQSESGEYPRPVTMIYARRIAAAIVRVGRADVWFTVVGRVG
jgi:hypothetical protein